MKTQVDYLGLPSATAVMDGPTRGRENFLFIKLMVGGWWGERSKMSEQVGMRVRPQVHRVVLKLFSCHILKLSHHFVFRSQ